VKRELLELAAELSRRGEPFALATVVARRAPMSAQPGDTGLVTSDGRFHGWVGGSCTQPTVVAEALRAISEGAPRLVALDPDPAAYRRPGVTVFAMTCHSGGSVEIHIQPVVPPPCLAVFGASPIARALVRLGHAMGYQVHVADPAATAADFPEAQTVTADPTLPPGGRGPLFAVVATQGEWDEDALRAALALQPAYLGVVASTRRFATMRAAIATEQKINNPAGLDLGASQPEEIALSILAEIVKQRRAAVAPAVEAAEARDPVCGMAVHPRDGTPRAEHQGHTHFFCCGGCRQKFVAHPEQYA
jgi:xanthine dehydrogenase accessory factor